LKNAGDFKWDLLFVNGKGPSRLAAQATPPLLRLRSGTRRGIKKEGIKNKPKLGELWLVLWTHRFC